MAQIEVYDIWKKGFSVKLTGLQTDGITYTRKCQWTVREKSSNNTAAMLTNWIEPSSVVNGEGGHCDIKELIANTKYAVSCYITRTDTDEHLTTLTLDVSTSNNDEPGGGEEPDQPDIDSGDWYVTDIDSVTISKSDKEYYCGFTIHPYEMCRITLKFNESGTVAFESAPRNKDLIGYLTLTKGTVDSNGIPTPDILVENDDSGQGYYAYNFYFTYRVQADTTYYLWARNANKKATNNCGVYVTTSAEETAVEYWNWKSSNGDASSTDTIRAFNAVTNRGKTTDFSHMVWNDMVQKVHDIRWASGLNWWDSSYGYEEDAKFSGSNEILTARMFNSLRNNLELVGISDYIGLGYTTGIGVANIGDVIKGEYFTTLTNYMNECIDKL